MVLFLETLGVPALLIGFLIIAISILVAKIALYITKRYLKPLAEGSKTAIDLDIIKAINVPVYFILILGGLYAALPYFSPYLPEDFLLFIHESLDVLGIVLIGVIAYKAYDIIITWYGRTVAKRTETKIDDVLMPIVNKIGKIFIILLATLSILNTFHIDVTAPLAGVGIASLAIALAAQDTISNFLAGFFIMLDHPFREGDTIQLPTGEVCEVVQIGVRRTRLYDLNTHNYIIVPNSDLSRWKIVNYELPNGLMKVTISLSVPIDQDTDSVKALLRQIASEARYASPDPPPEVFLTALTPTSQRLELSLHVSYKNRVLLLDEVNTRIKRDFAAKGIKLM
ncbi:mechanosensitive ion channel [Candidatus Bathyarchaeota archaeon]|nr:mechanosensitive ion channel [Candidatus Bathyarchaeota archaeon]